MRAQMVMGQYEDEAPIQSWNTFGIQTAASLGRGGAGFSIAADSSSSLFNPALLTRLPRLSICFSGSYNSASLYRYSIFNTGVFTSSRNKTLEIFSGDLIAVSGRIKGWAVSISVSGQENYRRPDLNWEYTFRSQPYYSMTFEQIGTLINANLSLARKISDRLSVGLGLNSVKGNLEKQVEESWFVSGVTITDRKSFDMKGFYLNGGIIWNVSENVFLAAVFRTPYQKKADSESLYRFAFPSGGTDIRIEGEGESVFDQPAVIGIGINSEIFREVFFAADVSYFNWSRYRANFFGEDLRREFKDVVKVNAGFELTSRYPLFGAELASPIRFGYIYDPQPMKEPDSFYYGLTLGTGVRFRNVLADFAYFIGKESGSGHSLAVRKILLTVSFATGMEL